MKIKGLYQLLLFLIPALCMGQTFQVTGVSPINQIQNAEPSTDIVVTFNEPVDIQTFPPTAFRVFGRWSGPAAGTLAMENNGLVVRFTPDQPFFAGEQVAVSLSKGLQNTAQEGLATAYSWNFWIRTKPGFLDQPFDFEINMRLAGEFDLQTYGAYAGDLNNDGYSDLTVVNETADDLRILLNDGTGHYSDFSIIPMGFSTPSPNEGADFNNDGEIDFVVSTAWDNQIRVLFGDGTGTLANMETYFNGDGARGVAVLDFNGDGWDDIFVTNRLSDNTSLLTNNGDATFSIVTSDTDGNGETAVAAADANGDGITDLFVAAYFSNEILLLLGDGNGNFVLSDKSAVQGQPWMISAADFNGDGHADVASANSSSDKTSVIFGDGLGGLGDAVNFSAPGAQFPLAIDAGDIDGDGDLDLAVSNYSSINYTVFENDGNGIFSAAATLNAAAEASCAILHDRDNDGDLDITGTDEGADVVICFENPGFPDAAANIATSPVTISGSPNPFPESIVFEWTLPEGNPDNGTKLILRDVYGRRIAVLESVSNDTCGGYAHWNGQIQKGIYFASLLDGQNNCIAAIKIIKE